MKYINEQIKAKVGGRKAPKMSIKEFKEKCDRWLVQNKTKLEEEGYDIYDGFNSIVPWIVGNGDEGFGFGKAIKDIHNKFEVYWENMDYEDSPRITKDGIPYWLFEGFSDYGPPVFWFLYWDGKNWRAYVPVRGNYVCPKKKIQFCEGYDNYSAEREALVDSGIIDSQMSDEDLEEYICSNILEGIIDISSKSLAIDEFENRLEVV